MRTAVLAAGLTLAATASAAMITGTPGPDRLVTWGNGSADAVRCGAGGDLVNADPSDSVARDCELVLRVVAADRTSRRGAQHATVAEPDSLAVGSTVVSVFQAGRFRTGGATAIGFATSRDGGRTWEDGLLPGLELFDRVSDPVIAYDPVRSLWLAATLGVSPRRGTGIMISRSADGLAWAPPIVVDSLNGDGATYDKEWLACDDWPASPLRGRCYLAYTDVKAGRIALRSSADAGTTWSAPAVIAGTGSNQVGAYPVTRPDGGLVVLFAHGRGSISAVHSTDGGASFGDPAALPAVRSVRPLGVRTVGLPIADVDGAGRIYVTWQECRPGCNENDVVVSTSDDAIVWSPTTILPLRSLGSGFAPALAVDRASGRVGVVAYTARNCVRSCALDAWLLDSADGVRWGQPRRLSARSISAEWAAASGLGAMLGDYFSISFVRGRPLPLVVLALPPRGPALRQALFVPTPSG